MKKAIIVILIIAVVGAGAFMLVRDKDTDEDQSNNQSSTQQTTEATQEESAEGSDGAETEVAATITYTDDGFSLDTSTVSVGSTIQIVNDSSETLDFASAVHPTHTDNSEFNVGIIEPGDSATFTVSETGSWGFHNHLNSGHTGEITVE